MSLWSCSTAPVVVPVPVPDTKPFPAEHMVQCEDLPPLPVGTMTWSMLFDELQIVQSAYDRCKTIHKGLVNDANKRVQGN
jgi:hypothetical protein